jgi:hypothetical protein
MSDSIKDVAWETFWEGYKLGYGVEETKPINKETARSRFERWWSRNQP